MKRSIWFTIGIVLMLLMVSGIILGLIDRNNMSKVIADSRPEGVLTDRITNVSDDEAEQSETMQVANCFFVNGIRIPYQGVEIYDGYAAIPLVKFLRASGGKVVWTSDDTATIEINGEEYVLDLESVWFGQTGDKFNYFHSVYGNYSPIRKRQGQELLIDTLTLTAVTQLMGSRAEIRIEDRVSISW